MRTTLKDLQKINLNATLLSENTTDAEWQEYFARMKMIVPPSNQRHMKGTYSPHLKEGEEYHGDTNAVRYKNFINGILSVLRRGEIDYCFFVYQIADLLKYEHDLKAKYLPEYECFELSL